MSERPFPSTTTEPPNRPDQVVVDLIDLLVTKGVLTRAEAADTYKVRYEWDTETKLENTKYIWERPVPAPEPAP